MMNASPWKYMVQFGSAAIVVYIQGDQINVSPSRGTNKTASFTICTLLLKVVHSIAKCIIMHPTA
jgi:hypothetical protein